MTERPVQRREKRRLARRRCGALLAAGVALLLLACGRSEPQRRPDVLLITVDTLRADHLGSYGYELDTSPNIDALAARGARFTDCTVPWPKTWPSMASMLTGAHPKTTGLRLAQRVIPESLTVLPEIFRDSGYRTGAVVANFNVGRTLGFDQGFGTFVESWEEKAPEGDFENEPGLVKRFTNAALVNEQALEWLGSLPRDDRFFLWLHYIDPHGPYVPPDEYLSLFQGDHPVDIRPGIRLPRYQVQKSRLAGTWIQDLGFYRAQYDREIRYLDDEIGRLLDGLRSLGRDRETLIVLTADHGESLGEHDYYLEHGMLPYQSTAHVPAIVVLPGVVPPGTEIERPVGLIDVSRTLVELAGLEPPGSFEGTSLVDAVTGRGDGGPDYVFMESGYDEARTQRTIRDGRWKLVHVTSPGDLALMTGAEYELYDLESDPGELRNLADEHPEVVQRLAAALERWAATDGSGHAPSAVPDPAALPASTRAMLRALGYGARKRADDPTAARRDGVVLIVLDTLRADRLSAAGHERPTTPTIDALARGGVLFEQAVTGAPWTLPAMISLVTGRHPSAAVFGPDRLRTTAVEVMRDAGVHTAAFTEGGFFSSHFGFDTGFERHRERATKVDLVADEAGDGSPTASGIEATFRAAEDWLRDEREEPFFLLVHTYEPHTPYRERIWTRDLPSGGLGRTLEQVDSNRIHLGEVELGPEELAYLSALYDGGVTASDRAVRGLFDVLRELGIADHVAVIVTSDHGEDLGGRDPRRAAEHGHSLYDELLRVPLVIHDPQGSYPVRRVGSQVRLIDVMPTVLDLLSLPPLPGADGRSLLPVMRGEETGDRVAFARVTRKGPPRVSVRDGRWKLIAKVDGDRFSSLELYDLSKDPGERNDLSEAEPARREQLEKLLREHVAELRDEGALDFSIVQDEVPEALREQLRALGYLE